jgi:superfamily II DNA/RNA helicase
MSQLKLNKQLLQGLAECGMTELSELQSKIIARTQGGSSFYLVENAADENNTLPKEDAMIVATLQRLNYSMPDTPRCVALASSNEEAQQLFEKIRRFAKYMDLKVHLTHEGGSLDHQNMAIYEGADVVVATPKRLIKLYFQCGININKTNLLLLYHTDKLVEQRFHQEIDRFVLSLPKFQTIAYTASVNDKVKKMCAKFMIGAAVIE